MTKDMSITRKIIAGVLCSIIIVMTMVYIHVFIIGSYVNTEVIYIQESHFDDSNLILKGDTDSSATGFSGYKLIPKDNTLYVKLRYSLVSKFNPGGSFIIEDTGNYKEFKKVYIQGPREDDLRLVLSK